jgi:methionyl aminopeptidase
VFPSSACISINEEVVHGIPGSRKLQEGDIVSIDVGVKKNGYYGDGAKTFAAGEISPGKSCLKLLRRAYTLDLRMLKTETLLMTFACNSAAC